MQPAPPVEGLITIRSCFGHDETLARLETAVRANGMSVVASVDHADGALEISVSPDATTLLVFGKRAREAAMVKARRLIALELPFKVLVWQDAKGRTLISYSDFRWLGTRYGVQDDEECLFVDVAVMIDGIVRKAASPP